MYNDAAELPRGTLSDPDIPGPAPASWLRLKRLGSLAYQAGPPVPNLTGWIEAAIAATNLDAIIDWSGATYANDIYMLVRVSVQGMPGSGRAVLGEFQILPTGGVASETIYVPGSCYMTQPEGLGGQTFILHAGGIYGLVWAIDIGVVGFFDGEAVSNFTVTAIAHGREV